MGGLYNTWQPLIDSTSALFTIYWRHTWSGILWKREFTQKKLHFPTTHAHTQYIYSLGRATLLIYICYTFLFCYLIESILNYWLTQHSNPTSGVIKWQGINTDNSTFSSSLVLKTVITSTILFTIVKYKTDI